MGETPSLTGEFFGETPRVLEHTQTHPPRNQHQKGMICLWVSEEVTENWPRAEQAALFPHAGTLGCRGLSCSPVVPPGLCACKCGTTCSTSHCLAASPLHPGCPSLPFCWSDECFFFTSFVVGLPYSSIFWQFWGLLLLLLFLNLLLSFFWLCKEAKCIYLHLHLGWKYLSFPSNNVSYLSWLTNKINLELGGDYFKCEYWPKEITYVKICLNFS